MTMVIDHGHFGFYFEAIEVAAMNIRVSKSQFKAKALEYFRQVEATGQPIIVTDHGRPVAEVRPHQQQESQEELLAKLKGSVTWHDDSTEPVDVEWDALKE